MPGPADTPPTYAGNPLFSVIMPTRNPGRYLAPAVESVLCQAGVDLELILVDDGTTDGSIDELRARHDPRLRVVTGPRQGIAACLNAGLDAARGSLIVRCDSDDLLPEGRLARDARWLQDHPGHVALCGTFDVIDPLGRFVDSVVRRSKEALDDVSPSMRHGGPLYSHLCAFTMRREAVGQVGGFRSYFETAEDIDFGLRLAETGPIGFLPEAGYRYRIHDQSITHTQKSPRRLFFERTAYAFARERAERGEDRLQRGDPPAPPPDADGAASRATDHIADLLRGRVWSLYTDGARADSLRCAASLVQKAPHRYDSWRTLLALAFKILTRPRRADT
jgi:glycosyltransferase involved in cell wall biosynthesis